MYIKYNILRHLSIVSFVHLVHLVDNCYKEIYNLFIVQIYNFCQISQIGDIMMKRQKVSELKPGMILAEDVYTLNEQLIFQKDLILSDKAITRLEFYDIMSVKINDDLPMDDSNSSMPEESATVFGSYSDHIKSSTEFKEFHAKFERGVSSFKSSINNIVEKNMPLDTQMLLEEVSEVFDIKNGKINIFTMLHNMRQYDDSTFAHSMNVSLICMVFASWLHMSEEEIQTAILSGLLHDVGKLLIPDSIIKKPNKLTPQEFEIIKTHPTRGYEVLKDKNISIHIKNAVLMHHEKCDGTGYPLGLTSEKIDPYAKMVAIADVYDATTSARIYRGSLCPFQVIELFEAEGFQKYDTKYILTFLENVVNTYLYETVELSNGIRGEIIFINKNDLARPMIKSGEVFYDLSKDKSLSIVKIV